MKIYSILLLAILLHSPYALAQTISQLTPSSHSWRCTGSQMLWGAEWYGIQIEKRVKSNVGPWFKIEIENWSAWSKSSITFGNEILMFSNPEKFELSSWVELGIDVESWKEISYREFYPKSNLGILFKNKDLHILGHVSMGKYYWPWVFSVKKIKMPISAEVSFNSNRYSDFWFMAIAFHSSRFRYSMEVQGPDLTVSTRISFSTKLNAELCHRQNRVGGSSIWSVEW